MNVELAITIIAALWGIRRILNIIGGAARLEKPQNPQFGMSEVITGLIYLALFVVIMFM